MFTHPAITAALAEQRRRDLITQADNYRLARAARDCRRSRPTPSPRAPRLTGLWQTARRTVLAATAALAAAAVLMGAPTGSATASAGHYAVVQSASHAAGRGGHGSARHAQPGWHQAGRQRGAEGEPDAAADPEAAGRGGRG